MKLVAAALVLLAAACGGAASPGTPDAGADAPVGNFYCDVPDGDAGAVFGAQCGADGADWVWADPAGLPHPCSEPPPLGAPCFLRGETGVVAD